MAASPSPTQDDPFSGTAKRPHTTLFVRQALFVFATVAVTVIALTAISDLVARRIIRGQIEQRLRVTIADRAEMLQMYVRHQHENVQLVTSRTRLRKLLSLRQLGQAPGDFETQLRQILRDAHDNSPNFLEIWIADPQGQTVAGTDSQRLGTQWADDPRFQRGLLGPYLSEPMFDADGYQAYLTAPIQDASMDLLGVVMVRVDLGHLFGLLANRTGLETTGEVLVARRAGDRASFLFAPLTQRPADLSLAEAPALAKAIDEEEGFDVDRFGDEQVFVAYRPVEYEKGDPPWGMIAKISAQEAIVPMTKLRQALWLVGAFLLLPALAAAYAYASCCARPIMRLADSAAALAEGRFDARVPVDTHDEVGRLSVAFNHMAAQLQSSYDTLERKVEQRTAELSHANEELKRSNRDLQQFAYVASHDLQEPLRAITGFTALLQEQYGSQLDEQAREYMDLTIDGARRMKLLIDNLLEFARVESQGKPFQSTDTQAVLQLALDNLSEAIEESHATVTHQGLGTIEADATQLVQVFQNLISNAIKFRGSEPPRIEIEAEMRDREVCFAVCDHGIGIAPRYHQKIFTIFQRLHSHSEFSGTGIGLAICQRIVQRHGGQIWVESEEGRGACFRFTIPQPPGSADAREIEGEQDLMEARFAARTE